MSRNRHINQADSPTDINISPMIDMVFILLIFFIVTTVFVDEKGVPIDKPTPKPPENQQDQEDKTPIVFRIERGGIIKYEDDEVNLARAEEIVKDVINQRDVPVILQVQRGSHTGRMIQVMDTARRVKDGIKITVSTVD